MLSHGIPWYPTDPVSGHHAVARAHGFQHPRRGVAGAARPAQQLRRHGGDHEAREEGNGGAKT